MDCESPRCSYRNSLRRFLRRSETEGVFLQGRWYCSLDCFEDAIRHEFGALLKLPEPQISRQHRIPLGLLLLSRGIITDVQLRSALAAQRQSGEGRLGRWLIKNGVASPQDISTALALQWGCGVYPFRQDLRYRDCSRMLPFVLLESSRMIPVHYAQNNQLLFLAFSEEVDHTALYSVERLLSARTEPCMITEDAMSEALEEVRSLSRPGEIVFETLWDPSEMARTVRDYAIALGAEELLLARPRRFLWVRMRAAGDSYDLLFRLPGERFA